MVVPQTQSLLLSSVDLNSLLLRFILRTGSFAMLAQATELHIIGVHLRAGQRKKNDFSRYIF